MLCRSGSRSHPWPQIPSRLKLANLVSFTRRSCARRRTRFASIMRTGGLPRLGRTAESHLITAAGAGRHNSPKLLNGHGYCLASDRQDGGSAAYPVQQTQETGDERNFPNSEVAALLPLLLRLRHRKPRPLPFRSTSPSVTRSPVPRPVRPPLHSGPRLTTRRRLTRHFPEASCSTTPDWARTAPSCSRTTSAADVPDRLGDLEHRRHHAAARLAAQQPDLRCLRQSRQVPLRAEARGRGGR